MGGWFLIMSMMGGGGTSTALIGQWSNVTRCNAPGRIDAGIKQGRIELRAPKRIEVKG